MASVHFTTMVANLTQPTAHMESHIFMKFGPVLTTLCNLGLKLLELFCVFLRAFGGFCVL